MGRAALRENSEVPQENNLLRALRASDYALIAPQIEAMDRASGELLYKPRDNVAIVYFPCGPSLVSFVVTNEDGHDMESVLIGREGEVGGIVSAGHLPA